MIAKLLAGKVLDPRLSTVERVAKALGCVVGELITRRKMVVKPAP